ncbi:MAG TPA: hypothetical protein VI942_11695, partial [Thermoanaerobaculia bacterium]|nr:hypothetical protein [Thermoanaerobaculia bacterium]
MDKVEGVAGAVFLGVEDPRAASLPAHLADVSDLPARLRVERRAIYDDNTSTSCGQTCCFDAASVEVSLLVPNHPG